MYLKLHNIDLSRHLSGFVQFLLIALLLANQNWVFFISP
jgi:hypothetical protein